MLAAPLAVVAALSYAPAAGAEPERFAIGMCYDSQNPLPQRPAYFDYNCDGTGVLHHMEWSTWDAHGARGVGTDIAVECQPNCAEGPVLINPVVVHAWNPQPAGGPACPPDARFYADMTIAYPENVPPWIQPGTEWYPGTDFVLVDGMPAVHYSGLTSNCEDHHR